MHIKIARAVEELPSNAHAILLFSGGFDSTLVALMLKSRGFRTTALTLDFETRPRQENRASATVASRIGFDDHLKWNIPLRDVRGPENRFFDTAHEAWCPHRNVVFFGLAVHLALRVGASIVASGVRAWDSPFYDDATPDYFSKLAEVLSFSGLRDIAQDLYLFAPLMESDAEARRALTEPGEWRDILELSRSCWRDTPKPCGECGPCITRARFYGTIFT